MEKDEPWKTYLRSAISSVANKHSVWEKRSQFNSEIWTEIFVEFFGKPPTSNNDPLWDSLLHKNTYLNKNCLGGLDILLELEKEYHEGCERKKREKRAAEYKKEQEEILAKLKRS